MFCSKFSNACEQNSTEKVKKAEFKLEKASNIEFLFKLN